MADSTFKSKCPACGTGLTITASDKLVGKLVKCPACGVASPYGKFKRLIPKKVDDHTQVTLQQYKYVVRLHDEVTGKSYDVPKGKHLVGRMTYQEPPKADIPIVTGDRGFSRAHFNLEIMDGRDGLNHAYISNANNKNVTKINGALLPGTDVVSLRNGDIISAAQTTLRFEMKRVFDESPKVDTGEDPFGTRI